MIAVNRIATRKEPELGPAVLLEAGGLTLVEIRHTDLTALNSVAKLLAAAELQAGHSLDDVFFHINRDGTIALAVGRQPKVWPEDAEGKPKSG